MIIEIGRFTGRPLSASGKRPANETAQSHFPVVPVKQLTNQNTNYQYK